MAEPHGGLTLGGGSWAWPEVPETATSCFSGLHMTVEVPIPVWLFEAMSLPSNPGKFQKQKQKNHEVGST